MRTIEITTTQKVTIQYPLAGLSDRFLAWLVDFFAILTGTFILYALIAAADFASSELEYLLVMPLIFFYTPGFELIANGQTPGKMALGTRVVRLNGEKPLLSEITLRWAFRWLDIYSSAGSIGAMLISSTPRSQRLGGMLSNTTVIKINNRSLIGLKDILKIDTPESYEITYPGVRQFSEQDMLLIKSAIDRSIRFRNKAHKEALNEVVKKVVEKLGERPKEKQQTDFLRTLIRDYIVLTR